MVVVPVQVKIDKSITEGEEKRKIVNNRVLRLPAIVLLNTTFRPGNSGLLRVYVQAF